MSEVLELTCALVRRSSVTPDDAGCQQVLAQRLQHAGFSAEHMRFGEVDNLWAWHGSGGPVLVYLGHTDVVPSGPVDAWTSPPFEPAVRDGALYGRGTADMKASVAAMTLALEQYVRETPDHPGTVALLITSDEEGPAKDGVRKVIEEFGHRGQVIDWCVVGEPSSNKQLGDVIRVGRRGSLNVVLTVHGKQGHVAYPQLALNPIHAAVPALAELVAERWDEGNESFGPTSLQISNIQAGTGANNIIPGQLQVVMNFRFSTASTEQQLRERSKAILRRHGLDFRMDWDLSGAPFLTKPGRLRAAVTEAVQSICGIEPRPDTGGGTSDGRFVGPYGAEVVEIGPVNASIHSIDEHVVLTDLQRLQPLYLDITRRLLDRGTPSRR